jgi:hypothetical protein
MAIASRLGPWLLGTVKETTGTTAGTIRNMGATIVAQNKAIAFGDGTAIQAFVVPAGAMITSVQLVQSGATFTSGSTGTVTVLLNGTSIGSTSITTGTAGTLSIAPSTQAQAALFANVGATDAIITYSTATLTAGSGILVMAYMVRNPDGTYGVNP